LLIDSLTADISVPHEAKRTAGLLLQRAVAYSVIQNYEDAIRDLNACIEVDSTSSLAYWQRAVCESMMNDFNLSLGMNDRLKAAKVLADFNEAIRLNPQNAYLYYDRANFHVSRKDYSKAIDDYTQAVRYDSRLAEAYYNRGLVRFNTGEKASGALDLSKAGELGLFDAYSIIKRYNGK
jgi:tetratricopeptide repeat protein